jgi:uncharacterized cupin superfamily protein
MRKTTLVTLVVAAFFCSAPWITASNQNGEPVSSSQKQPIMVTRLYTGPDGQSHIYQSPIALRGSPVAQTAPIKMRDAYIVRAAPGTFEPLHNADEKRYVVVISGEAEVTTTSGQKARVVPGQIYLAEDLTGKGHTFRVVGNDDWTALFVNFATE